MSKKKRKSARPLDRIDEKSNLISQGTSITIQNCTAYLQVPAGFIRQYWKEGSFTFEDLEKWIRSPHGNKLLQQWEGASGKPKTIEGCTVRYVQRHRKKRREIPFTIYDCSVSRKKDLLIVKSGQRFQAIPLALRTLEIQLPYGGEFKSPMEVFG